MTINTQTIPSGYKQTEVGVIPNDWEVNELGTVCKYQNGKSLEKYFCKDDGYKVVSIGNYSTSGKYVENDSYINRNDTKFVKKYMLNDHDLTMILNDKTSTGEIIGRVLLIEGSNKYVFNQRTMRLTSLGDIFAEYLYFLINSDGVHNKLANLAKPGTQIYFNTSDVLNFKIGYPSDKTEQFSITEVLHDIDSLIQKTEKLIAKKRAIKHGAMYELLTGKRRLPGFSGEWKNTVIGSAIKVKHGKSQKEVVCDNGKYPILATGGEIGRTNVYLYNKPSVLIGRKGTIDKPQFMDTPFWTVDTLFYTQIEDENDPKYIYYVFNTIDWYSYNEASGVPSLNAKTIENIEIVLPPTKDEQIAIASTLNDFDSEIEGLSKVLEKYNEIKQGAMQVLLTGKVRLIKN